MPYLEHDGIQFHYIDSGNGIPFIFQHGLGGDVNQTAEIYDPQTGLNGVRFISLDCRGHGETKPLGSAEKINFDTFADDVIALMDYLGLSQAIVGGISMGAGVSMNMVLRYANRVSGLVLSRIAWLDKPLPHNLAIFVEIGNLIAQYGAQQGLAQFQQSAEYMRLLREAPDTASSLAGQFLNPRAEETVAKLLRMPNDAPNHNRAAWRNITVPALILANYNDPTHPFEYGEIAGQLIPKSEVKTITPKSVNKHLHIQELRRYIQGFIEQQFLK